MIDRAMTHENILMWVLENSKMAKCLSRERWQYLRKFASRNTQEVGNRNRFYKNRTEKMFKRNRKRSMIILSINIVENLIKGEKCCWKANQEARYWWDSYSRAESVWSQWQLIVGPLQVNPRQVNVLRIFKKGWKTNQSEIFFKSNQSEL